METNNGTKPIKKSTFEKTIESLKSEREKLLSILNEIETNVSQIDKEINQVNSTITNYKAEYERLVEKKMNRKF